MKKKKERMMTRVMITMKTINSTTVMSQSEKMNLKVEPMMELANQKRKKAWFPL